jgi:hypothetical protein
MNTKIAAALFALVALPAAAATSTDTPRVDQREAKQAKSDGVVTKKERTQLARAQDKQSRKIHRQKHDKQKQAPAT